MGPYTRTGFTEGILKGGGWKWNCILKGGRGLHWVQSLHDAAATANCKAQVKTVNAEMVSPFPTQKH